MKGTIIISVKSGSGKDMMAQFMKEELAKHGQKALVIHFGDAVKWFCRDFLDWDGKKDEVGRTLLQMVGTDIVRAKHPNFWTGIVVGLIQAFEPTNDFDLAIVHLGNQSVQIQFSFDSFHRDCPLRISAIIS